MFNMRNQLDKSSSTQPIRVQNLLQYPGQEYGQYAPRNPSYYNNANNQYNNYDNSNVNGANSNSNSNNNNNFFSYMFSGFFNANGNSNNNNRDKDNSLGNNNNNVYVNNNNDNYGAGGYNTPNNAQIGVGPIQEGVRTVGGMIRPIIDSIFDIPISTLRAVNNLVGRLTGSYQIKLPFQQQQQQQQHQSPPHQAHQQQQYSPSLPFLPSFPFFAEPTPTPASSPYYGVQKSANAQPKSEIEVLKRIRQIGSGNQQQQKPTTNASL
ncbi:putative uncharacterized protein DDB_G0286901 isoform X2 [Musca domestica]|uniref:Uncharacterized protein n=1 Tax=Musca domestica TaxID=7370 RepID=A0ABM3VM89_MUSDO|nr:putative uncharacterized protein DDB_G0286901 isoform X2 [Musca domestica]